MQKKLIRRFTSSLQSHSSSSHSKWKLKVQKRSELRVVTLDDIPRSSDVILQGVKLRVRVRRSPSPATHSSCRGWRWRRWARSRWSWWRDTRRQRGGAAGRAQSPSVLLWSHRPVPSSPRKARSRRSPTTALLAWGGLRKRNRLCCGDVYTIYSDLWMVYYVITLNAYT